MRFSQSTGDPQNSHPYNFIGKLLLLIEEQDTHEWLPAFDTCKGMMECFDLGGGCCSC